MTAEQAARYNESEDEILETRSLESRMAIAIRAAHLFVNVVEMGVIGNMPEYIKETGRRLAVVLDEAETLGLLSDAPGEQPPLPTASEDAAFDINSDERAKYATPILQKAVRDTDKIWVAAGEEIAALDKEAMEGGERG